MATMQVISLMTLAIMFGCFDVQEALQKRAIDCHEEGRIYYPHKPPKSLGERRDCSVFWCKNGIISNYHDGCVQNGSCYYLRESAYYNCSLYTCTPKDGMAPTKLRCSFNGSCYEIGETANNSCLQYTCKPPDSEGQVLPEMSLTKLGCSFNGSCYEIGETANNSCSQYTCKPPDSEGQVLPEMSLTKLDCPLNGECHSVGHVDTRNGCDRYVCTNKTDGTVGYQFEKENTCCVRGSVFQSGVTFSPPGDSECIKFHCFHGDANFVRDGCQVENTCIPVGGTLEQACRFSTCKKSTVGPENKYKLLATRTECQLDDACIPVGVTVKHKCTTFNCTKVPMGPEFEYRLLVTKPACESDKTCIPLGASIDQLCGTLTCTEVPVGTEFEYKLLETRADCKFGDTCIPLGFAYYMNVCERYVCTNKSDGTVDFVFQKEDTCCVNGTVYKDGDAFTPPGDTDCVKCICDKGDVTYIREGCDVFGICIPPGITVQHNCKSFNCTKTAVGPRFDYKLFETSTACRLRDTCIPEGVSVDTDCRTLTCTKSAVGSVFEYKMRATRRDCRFSDACNPVGSTLYAHGCVRYDCRNGSDGLPWPFYQRENTCCMKETFFDDGEIFTPPGESDCVQSICLTGRIFPNRTECEHNNTCIALGKTVKQDCKTLTCTEFGVGPYYKYKLVETKTDCEN